MPTVQRPTFRPFDTSILQRLNLSTRRFLDRSYRGGPFPIIEVGHSGLTNSPEGQDIVAKHFYRSRLASVARKYAQQFPIIDLFAIDDTFGGWTKAQETHFSDSGVFDQIYQPKG